MKTLKKILLTIVMMGLGAGVGALIATIAIKSTVDISKSDLYAIILFLIPGFFVAVGVHEAGHALAGVWMKFDFRMYVVGPFMWQKKESGWRFTWNKNFNLFGGMVICLPPSSDRLAQRFSVYALGGPAASLVLAAVAFGIYRLLSVDPQSALSAYMLLFGVLNFMLFLVTIIPVYMGGFYTDGARAVRFLRGGDTARFDLLLMKTIMSSTGGMRPRLLNTAEINEGVQLGERLNAPMRVYLHYYMYQSAFDQGNMDDAELHLNRYLDGLENVPVALRGMIYLDAAYFHAYARRDLVRAESFFNKYKPSALIPKGQLLATEAALLSLRSEDQAFEVKMAEALKEIPNMLDRGVAIALGERLMEMKTRIGAFV
jgi:hypothetical protein